MPVFRFSLKITFMWLCHVQHLFFNMFTSVYFILKIPYEYMFTLEVIWNPINFSLELNTLCWQITFSHFLLVSLMARIDNLESQKSAKNSKTTIVGTKLLRFVPTGTQYSCIKSSEIKVDWRIIIWSI